MRARSVLIVAVATLVAAPSALAAFPGRNGLIAFDKAKQGRLDIWVMSLKGGKPRDVTRTRRFFESFPSFSPNGRTIAFVWTNIATAGRQKNGIGIVNSDGSGMRHLTSAAEESLSYNAPHFTADGKRILYWKDRPSATGLNYAVWAIPAKGGAERPVTSGPDCCVLPSPDGRHIAYVHQDPNAAESELTVAAPNGANPRPVGRYFPSDWSPDGRKFIEEGPRNDVFTFSADDGSNLARLVGLPTHDETPVFSPDGRFVIWTNEGTHDIWIASSKGAGARNLSHTPGFEKNPSWGRAAKGH